MRRKLMSAEVRSSCTHGCTHLAQRKYLGHGTEEVTKMAGKRANGEGSVYRDGASWAGQLTIDGRRRKVRARTKTETLAKMASLKRAADDGAVIEGNATVGQMIARWRDRDLAGRTMAPATRGKYLWALAQLETELGHARLRTLDVNAVERGLDRIATGRHGRGQPLSRTSIARIRDTLVAVLDFAMRRKAIATNPARLAVVAPTAAAPQKRRALEADEATALWDALEGERLGPLFRVMLLTGLRPGEALGLCWDAVDLKRGELTVRRSVRLNHGAAQLVDELKTSASYRTIALPAPAVEELRAQRRAVAELELASRTWAPSGPALVFPTINGTPWNLRNVRRELERICDDHALPVVKPNELRHSCASVLSAQGVPLELIADLLGHTSTRMLDQTYRHRPRRAVDAAVDVMGQLFSAR
jgi:integrase